MKKLLFISALSAIFALNSTAQCENWKNSPDKDAIETAHVLYRDFVKAKDFDNAFPQWEKAFKGAPAADGNRSFHYSDGVELLLHKYNSETDEAEKAEHAAKINKLYDGWATCFPKEAAYLRGRQAYNQFYTLRTPYVDNVKTVLDAIEKGGNKTEYIVIDPLARITVAQFKEKEIDAAEARDRHAKIMKLAEHNIANDKTYGQYYQQALDGAVAVYAEIEREIFDCKYFKAKHMAEYKADPTNKEVARRIYKLLLKGGCDNSDPEVYEIYLKDSLATMDEFKKNNPGYLANELYKSGDYSGAIAKYTEAIASETDASKKASYYFSIGSIQFRKLKSYGDARRNALKAAELRSGWGQPYLMIGDMYASSSSSCGKDAFTKGLAVLAALDKYNYAKSIDSDPTVQSEARTKINKYAAFKPDGSDAFMMGVKSGDSKKVPCWIGETVKVRFK